MFLNIPIGKGTTEAMTTIKYKTETIVHQLKPNSVLTVSGPRHTQGRQDLEVKPVNGGRCAILVFHLLWMDSIPLNVKPDDFAMFIKAASDAHEALKAWIQPQSTSNKNKAPTPLATSKKGQKLSMIGQKNKSLLSPHAL